ncbi:hypothetical protein QJS10_CPA02g00999 [Acorus calamus]|uniref:Uncharacterized protein n=1 Tax=Acorus calamus TaxID=4465 RepID=A0AAV9FAV0_ACOCL|nr:hypothetical protein QJS10_CPA02g00999 [Acorus calamus]
MGPGNPDADEKAYLLDQIILRGEWDHLGDILEHMMSDSNLAMTKRFLENQDSSTIDYINCWSGNPKKWRTSWLPKICIKLKPYNKISLLMSLLSTFQPQQPPHPLGSFKAVNTIVMKKLDALALKPYHLPEPSDQWTSRAKPWDPGSLCLNKPFGTKDIKTYNDSIEAAGDNYQVSSDCWS